MPQVKVQVEGLEPCLKRLRGLKQSLQNKIAKKALREAAKPILQAARSAVPIQANASPSGTLKKALGQRPKSYRRSGASITVVGVRKGMGKMVSVNGGKARKQDPANIAHLVEKGHQVGQRGFSLRRLAGVHQGLGTVAARPFMQPAWDQNVGQAASIMESVITQGIEEHGI